MIFIYMYIIHHDYYILYPHDSKCHTPFLQRPVPGPACDDSAPKSSAALRPSAAAGVASCPPVPMPKSCSWKGAS